MRRTRRIGPEPWYRLMFTSKPEGFFPGVHPGKSVERVEILIPNRKFMLYKFLK